MIVEEVFGSECPACGEHATKTLGAPFAVPVLMNRVYRNQEDARRAPMASVQLFRCAKCGFTGNKNFRSDLIAYDGDYENDQTTSPVFARHVEARAKEIVEAAEPLRFLEVGCGQGNFLALVARMAGPHLESAEGFDPAWRGLDGEGPAGSRIHKRYFDRASAAKLRSPPNVVATRHTIEHVPQPYEFLSAIRGALGPKAETEIFVETPCVDWIFSNGAMQDFFYEHCSIFTARALSLALTRAGFHSPVVEHVFEGQYLWARASTLPGAARSTTPEPMALVDASAPRDAFVEHWRDRVTASAAKGGTALWGAGAKGVNFALMLSQTKAIDHVVDINLAKQGRFLGGSALPVLSPEDSVGRKIATYFVMNANYLDEIAARLKELGSAAELVAIEERTPT